MDRSDLLEKYPDLIQQPRGMSGLSDMTVEVKAKLTCLLQESKWISASQCFKVGDSSLKLCDTYRRKSKTWPDITSAEVLRASEINNIGVIVWEKIPEWYVYSWEINTLAEEKIYEFMIQNEWIVFSFSDFQWIVDKNDFSRILLTSVLYWLKQRIKWTWFCLEMCYMDNTLWPKTTSWYVYCKVDDFTRIQEEFIQKYSEK